MVNEKEPRIEKVKRWLDKRYDSTNIPLCLQPLHEDPVRNRELVLAEYVRELKEIMENHEAPKFEEALDFSNYGVVGKCWSDYNTRAVLAEYKAEFRVGEFPLDSDALNLFSQKMKQFGDKNAAEWLKKQRNRENFEEVLSIVPQWNKEFGKTYPSHDVTEFGKNLDAAYEKSGFENGFDNSPKSETQQTMHEKGQGKSVLVENIAIGRNIRNIRKEEPNEGKGDTVSGIEVKNKDDINIETCL